MKNVSEMRTRLSKVFDDLETGKVDPRVAKQMNNSAGKILYSIRVQLEQSSLRNERPDIDWLKVEK
jgi:hypothetical protein